MERNSYLRLNDIFKNKDLIYDFGRYLLSSSEIDAVEPVVLKWYLDDDNVEDPEILDAKAEMYGVGIRVFEVYLVDILDKVYDCVNRRIPRDDLENFEADDFSWEVFVRYLRKLKFEANDYAQDSKMYLRKTLESKNLE